jgi:hypothetical protein
MTRTPDDEPAAFPGANPGAVPGAMPVVTPSAPAQDGGEGGMPERVSEAYRQAPLTIRARLLEHLLRPVGPLALVALAAGAFGHLMFRLGRNALPVSIEDAARISAEHVLELARYVEQSSPAVLAQIAPLVERRGPGAGAPASMHPLASWGYPRSGRGAAATG